MSAENLKLQIEYPAQPEILRMLKAGDAYYEALYPAESNHLLDVQSLCLPEVVFYVARINRVACGFGALALHDGYGEIKRLFVDSPARGRGIGRRLIEALETHARQIDLPMLRLETGVKQAEALAMYRSVGFRECEPFDEYLPDRLSIFMEKPLRANRFFALTAGSRQPHRELCPAREDPVVA